jgi:fucose permease
LEPYFEAAPAAVLNRAGVLFGCGCLISTGAVAITYFAGSAAVETALLAVIPLVFFFVYAVNRFPAALTPVPQRSDHNRLQAALRDLRSIGAVLFSFLLFFQFGNEWSIAAWLPLFLIHRLGANPQWAILALALFFLAVTTGRLIAQRLLARMSHRRLLVMGTLAAMAGYLLLSFTQSMAGAWIAVLVIGAGFAPIYPIIAETLDDRFSYHPAYYNGIFSVAITGAMSTPWLLGYVDKLLGTQYVMLIPAFGSIAVLILTLLLLFEAHLMVGTKDQHAGAMAVAAGDRR